MRTTNCQRAIALLVITCFLLTSCMSLHDVQLPASDQPTATPAVKVGEIVEVTTRDGEKKRFAVTAVEADALVGQDVRVAYKDMTSLKVERSAAEKPTKIALIVIGGLLLVGALVLASGGGGSPGY